MPSFGKNITRKKGKQFNLPFNIEAVGKNIKWERREGDEHFGEENDFKKWGWGRLSSYWEFYTALSK